MVSLLAYTTGKKIIVDVWPVGLLHRLLQIGVLIFALWEAVSMHTWALHEIPHGSANIYAQSNDVFQAALRADGTHPYCAGSQLLQYEFKDSDDWNYKNPTCLPLDDKDVTFKGPSSLFITTAYIETELLGWPCHELSSSDAAVKARAEAKKARCTGTVEEDAAGTQCKCEVTRTIYPIAVEELDVYFNHAFDTTPKAGDINGSTYTNVITRLDFGNGTSVQFCPTAACGGASAGASTFPKTQPNLKLRDILYAAGISSLDETNNEPRGDANDPSKKPMFRTTGALLTLVIEYSNEQDGSIKVSGFDDKVHADVKARHSYPGWAGWGTLSSSLEAPSGTYGNQNYHTLIRYRQGIVIEVNTKGLIYWFDQMSLLNLIISTVVLLAICRTVVDFIIFKLPAWVTSGLSTILARRRSEVVNRTGAFAELGLKAAVAADTFVALDRDRDGKLSFSDLVNVFGGIDYVQYDKACAIAKSVMRDAGCKKGKQEAIDFSQFMKVLEGDTIDFDQYLKFVKKTGNLDIDEESELQAAKLYKARASGVFIPEELDPENPKAPAAAPALAAPQTQTQPAPVQQLQPQQPQPQPQQQLYPTPVPQHQNPYAAAAGPSQLAPPQPAGTAAQSPIKMCCGNVQCHRQFMAPPGHVFVGCPHCGTTNKVQAQPVVQPMYQQV